MFAMFHKCSLYFINVSCFRKLGPGHFLAIATPMSDIPQTSLATPLVTTPLLFTRLFATLLLTTRLLATPLLALSPLAAALMAVSMSVSLSSSPLLTTRLFAVPPQFNSPMASALLAVSVLSTPLLTIRLDATPPLAHYPLAAALLAVSLLSTPFLDGFRSVDQDGDLVVQSEHSEFFRTVGNCCFGIVGRLLSRLGVKDGRVSTKGHERWVEVVESADVIGRQGVSCSVQRHISPIDGPLRVISVGEGRGGGLEVDVVPDGEEVTRPPGSDRGSLPPRIRLIVVTAEVVQTGGACVA